MKKVFITLGIVLIIGLSILYSSYIIQAPVSGYVYDSKTNEPLINFPMHRRIKTLFWIIPNPGGQVYSDKGSEYTRTDKNGKYYFGWYIRSTIPIIEKFSESYLGPYNSKYLYEGNWSKMYMSWTSKNIIDLHFRYKFFHKQKDIYLFPSDLSECSSLVNQWLIKDCKEYSAQIQKIIKHTEERKNRI